MKKKKKNEFLDKDNTAGKHYKIAGLQLFRQTFFAEATSIPIGFMGSSTSTLLD